MARETVDGVPALLGAGGEETAEDMEEVRCRVVADLAAEEETDVFRTTPCSGDGRAGPLFPPTASDDTLLFTRSGGELGESTEVTIDNPEEPMTVAVLPTRSRVEPTSAWSSKVPNDDEDGECVLRDEVSLLCRK